MPSQRLFAEVRLTVDATGTVEEVTTFHGFQHLLNGNCNGSQLVSSFCSKLLAMLIPFCSSSVPSLSFSVSSQPVMFFFQSPFFQALRRPFFPSPSTNLTAVPSTDSSSPPWSQSRSKGRQWHQHQQCSGPSIPTALSRPWWADQTDPDEFLLRATKKKLQGKKLLESVRWMIWMVFVYITADLPWQSCKQGDSITV